MNSKSSIIWAPLLLSLALLVYQQPAFAEDQAAGKDMDYNVGRMGDPAGVNPEEFEFSPAEEKLWLSDHLKNVPSPTKLFYEFEKKGSFEEGLVDSVILEIIYDNDDGTKNTRMEFFTEERNQSIPEAVTRNITGNPVLGIYLQGDAYEMDRLTEGHWRYFHRKIKLALTENKANLEPVSIDFDGHTVPGDKITILPYVRDPRRSQFEQFANKRYEFILSKEIPGTLYQIKTLVPDNSDSANGPLIEETLTLREVKSSS